MFTGIVEALGTVESFEGGRLVVRAAATPEIGASIAVNGTCLTVVEAADGTLAFDLSRETVERTSLRRLRPGARVNLERPLTLLARLGGHLVQGHVDGVGEVIEVRSEPDGGATIAVRIPSALLRYVVEKGSIAIDGVSLTVATVEGDRIEVALIPHTLAVTTFGEAQVGDSVNVEADVLAKHVTSAVERMLADRVPVRDTGAVAEGSTR